MSVMNIYVGNLSYGMSESELRDAFAAFGEVSSAKILMDRETGRSRGFGFVEMPNQGEAEAAIAQLNGKDLGGRALRINEARPPERRGAADSSPGRTDVGLGTETGSARRRRARRIETLSAPRSAAGRLRAWVARLCLAASEER